VNRAVSIDENIQDRAQANGEKPRHVDWRPKLDIFLLFAEQSKREAIIGRMGLRETSGAIPCSPAPAFGSGTGRCYWNHGRLEETTLSGGVIEDGTRRNSHGSNAAPILVGAGYAVSIFAQVLACILSLPIADLVTG
jgi:hypothetical protein